MKRRFFYGKNVFQYLLEKNGKKYESNEFPFLNEIVYNRPKSVGGLGWRVQMNFVILMGSPRLTQNTAELCKPFMEEINANGSEVRYITLADKKIAPCKGCYSCQNVNREYGCPQKDDMYLIVDEIIKADCIVLATPIYSWYCTAEMKAVLDRHYGLNKFYGSARGSLWEGKKVAILATHGYEREYAVQPFEMGIKRLCEHSGLNYAGLYSVRDEHDLPSFQTPEAIGGAKAFARSLLENYN